MFGVVYGDGCGGGGGGADGGRGRPSCVRVSERTHTHTLPAGRARAFAHYVCALARATSFTWLLMLLLTAQHIAYARTSHAEHRITRSQRELSQGSDYGRVNNHFRASAGTETLARPTTTTTTTIQIAQFGAIARASWRTNRKMVWAKIGGKMPLTWQTTSVPSVHAMWQSPPPVSASVIARETECKRVLLCVDMYL